ncbi:Vng6344h (plasmid) [Halobacterium salinarum NRC-1]|uniref:Vng6344h n=2 Tax=Halobacterium salinarum NRC-34001 TaxID=2886895 RepID=Q9HHL0_HALSA|nr:Vng6344h [Halobacterium salinarum NRC-1]
MDLVNQEVSLIRQAKPLELKKIPVGRCLGSNVEFQL